MNLGSGGSKKAIGSKWVFKVKHKLMVDINNAFLHGFLDEDIYMKPPDGALIPTGKDLGPAKYFLGLEIARCDTGTLITQHKYIRDIIHDAGLTDCKPASTPLPIGLKLSAQHSDPLPDPGSYRRLVGRLLYLSFTRPDIFLVLNSSDLHLNPPTPIPLYCDNQVAIHIVAIRSFTNAPNTLKSTAIWFGITISLALFFLLMLLVSQLADIFTKSLPASAFYSLLSKLALVSPSQVQLEGGLMRLQNSSSNSYASDFSCQHVFTSTRTRVT
ncbi:UNVERIFIED_CONTAM: putative mitochondrial protein [Sesamum latifolium]|uniref:Mitochondrial protein n=1 Tax=Sesamum latifolium TaxID=2727402 RepID=A0AAW2SGA5_9LAMI